MFNSHLVSYCLYCFSESIFQVNLTRIILVYLVIPIKQYSISICFLGFLLKVPNFEFKSHSFIFYIQTSFCIQIISLRQQIFFQQHVCTYFYVIVLPVLFYIFHDFIFVAFLKTIFLPLILIILDNSR